MARLLKRWTSLQVLWPSRLLLLNAGASPQRLLQIDWHAMLLEQIGEGFLREFLQRRHPVPAELRQRGHRLVVESNSLRIVLTVPSVDMTDSHPRLPRSRRRSRNLHRSLGLVLGCALTTTTNWQQHFALTFNALARLFLLRGLRGSVFVGEATLERVHKADDVGLARSRRVDDTLAAPLAGDQLNERSFIMVFKFLRFERARFLLDNMFGEIQHVFGNLHVLNVIEIF